MIMTRNTMYKAVISTLVFMLAFGLFGSMWAEPVSAASSRAASVTEVKGTAYLKKAGGSKPFPLFNRMTVNQGDVITTEKDSSVRLTLIDRDDEITIGENAEVYISDLLDQEGSSTGMKVWAGSVYAKVSELGGADQFKIDTPNATMGVRGTHFTVSMDPVTGLPYITVHSGGVLTSPLDGSGGSNQSSTSKPVIIVPSIQASVFSGPDDETSGVIPTYFDPDMFLENADPSIIAAILRSKAEIDRENEEQINENSDLFSDDEYLDLSENDALDRYRNNVENSLFHLLKRSVENNKLPEDQVKDIIEEANNNITDADKQYDLDREVPPIDRTAGIDPKKEAERQRQMQETKKRNEERERKRQESINNNQILIDQIQQRAQQQQERNEQAQQEKSEQAVDRYMSNLTEEQRRALEQRIRETQEGRTASDAPPAPASPAPSRPSVPNPPVNPGNPDPEHSPSVKLSVGGWDGQQLVVDVVMADFPGDYYGAQLHILFDARHFMVMGEEGESIESYAGELFKDSVDAYKASTGHYAWVDGAEPSLTTEIVYTVLSTGEVTNDPIGSDGRLLLRIPLQYIGTDPETAGGIILKEVIVTDSEGQPLPYDIVVTDVPVVSGSLDES